MKVLDGAGRDELDDLRGAARPDAIDRRERLRIGPGKFNEIDGRRLCRTRNLGVCENSEGVGPGEFKQNRELLEQSHDVGVAHGASLHDNAPGGGGVERDWMGSNHQPSVS